MNMLRPSMASMRNPGDNSNAFVVAVAKHARELAQEAEDSHEIMEEKPVKKSVEDFSAGKFRMGEVHQEIDQ